MKRIVSTLLALLICGLGWASHDDTDKGKPRVTALSERDIVEKIDGKKTRATTVEVFMRCPVQVLRLKAGIDYSWHHPRQLGLPTRFRL